MIDGIWYTPDLELRDAAYLPFDADMADHPPNQANFTQALLLGVNLPYLVYPAARRLNSQVAIIRYKCIKDSEEKFRQGQFLERLKKIAQ